MKLVLQIEVSHDVLGIDSLVRAIPQALGSVTAATGARIAETGPDGMVVQVPGTGELARVRFKLTFEESARMMPATSP